MGRPDWKALAIELGGRMRNYAFCDEHPVSHPGSDCPFCLDRTAYLRFEKAANAQGIKTTTLLDDELAEAIQIPVQDV